MDKTWLTQYQNQFIDEVFEKNSHPEFMNNIDPIGKLNPREVMNVYQNDYFARLQDALGENYEAVWAVVGDEEFFKLGREYIEKNPSRAPDLTPYGENFPAFIKEHSLGEEFPFLPELAIFEREFWKLFHAAPFHSEFNFSTLTEDILGQSRFEFTENLRLFSWSLSLYDIWEQRHEGFNDGEFDFSAPQSIALYKTTDGVKAWNFNQASSEVLKNLISGKTVSESIEVADLVPQDLQLLFSFLSSEGVIAN